MTARQRADALSDRLAEKRWRNGRLYFRLKQYDAADYYLRSVIAEYPRSVWAGEARILLADVYVRQRKYDEAAATLREVAPSEASPDVKRRAQERLRELEARGKS